MYNVFGELKIEEFDPDRPWKLCHVKRDGYALAAKKDERGNLQVHTRTPRIVTSSQEWYKRLQDCLPRASTIFGELYVEGGTSSDVRSVLCKEPKFEGVFEYFSVMKLENADCRNATDLPNLKGLTAAPYIEFSPEIPLGIEGYVLKTNQFPQFMYDWMKYKREDFVDVRIVGFEDGEPGKYFGMVGSLICSTDDGKLNCRTSGFSDELRKDFTENKKSWLGKIVEIKYTESTKRSLRHARLIRIRDDKSTTTEIK